MREMPHQRIHYHISRPGIECENVFELRARGNHGDVCNPPDVQRGAQGGGEEVETLQLGDDTRKIDVALRVWDFTLPDFKGDVLQSPECVRGIDS